MQKPSNKTVFTITQSTQAILKNVSSYYKSLILEENNQYYSTFSPEKILDHSCIIFGASLQGRRTSIKKMFDMNSKIPIPVNPQKGIYMIPTASTRSEDCVWISYYHIDSYTRQGGQTCVRLTDGKKLIVKSSFNSFDMQHKRASQIIAAQNRFLFFEAESKYIRGIHPHYRYFSLI